MKIRSSKAKGKRLEQWIRDKLLEAFPTLDSEDVRTTVGVEAGADIKLTKKALLLFPYKIEAKNRETLKSIYDFYAQAEGHKGDYEPIVIIKMNRKKPLILLDAEHFIELIRKING